MTGVRLQNRRHLPLFFLLLFVSGCDSDRLNKLEKQNEDLKAQVEKCDIALDYDLQAKCSKDASLWFGRNFSRDKDTILLDYSNHYNKAMNKCFISVERHFNSTRENWYDAITLWDMYKIFSTGKSAKT